MIYGDEYHHGIRTLSMSDRKTESWYSDSISYSSSRRRRRNDGGKRLYRLGTPTHLPDNLPEIAMSDCQRLPRGSTHTLALTPVRSSGTLKKIFRCSLTSRQIHNVLFRARRWELLELPGRDSTLRPWRKLCGAWQSLIARSEIQSWEGAGGTPPPTTHVCVSWGRQSHKGTRHERPIWRFPFIVIVGNFGVSDLRPSPPKLRGVPPLP